MSLQEGSGLLVRCVELAEENGGIETERGTVRLIEFMPPRKRTPDIVRIVEGLDGEVPMRSELIIRFDLGRIVPWVRRIDHSRVAIAGPDALCLRTPVEVHGENLTTISDKPDDAQRPADLRTAPRRRRRDRPARGPSSRSSRDPGGSRPGQRLASAAFLVALPANVVLVLLVAALATYLSFR